MNDVTKKDSYPLPQIHETLAGTRWFLALYLHIEVELDHDAREKTACGNILSCHSAYVIHQSHLNG